MNDLLAHQNESNTLEKVKFRQSIVALEKSFEEMIESGEVQSLKEECTLTHYFAPIDQQFGCCTYARQIFLPKGSLVIGKIHRHQHLNFILKGKVSVATEFGKKYFEAPCTFISEVGLKRAVYAEEDTIWTTVHLTAHSGEENLDKIEQEVISPTYDELNLISSVDELTKLANQGE
jgi:hypothetical protein